MHICKACGLIQEDGIKCPVCQTNTMLRFWDNKITLNRYVSPSPKVIRRLPIAKEQNGTDTAVINS